MFEFSKRAIDRIIADIFSRKAAEIALDSGIDGMSERAYLAQRDAMLAQYEVESAQESASAIAAVFCVENTDVNF